MKEIINMPCVSSAFPFSQCTTPRGCVLPFEKHCSIGCKLKPRIRIHKDKLLEQFSLHFCDFISWIMGAAYFMDQMTESLGLWTQYSAIIQLIWLMLTVKMSISLVTGVSCFWGLETTSNLRKKCSFEGIKLRRIPCSSPLPPYVLCPLIPPPPSHITQYFFRIFISGHAAHMYVVSLNYL